MPIEDHEPIPESLMGLDIDSTGVMSESNTKAKVRSYNPTFVISAAERYGKDLRRYLHRRLGGPQEVDDLAQEVYMKLLRIDAELQVRKPLAFVYTVAARVLADHRTEAAQERAYVSFSADTGNDSSDRVSDALSDRLEEHLCVQQQIERALAQIPNSHASVLLMVKRDGMSYEEVASKLNLSMHTVHKYLQEARAQLRRQRWDKEAD